METINKGYVPANTEKNTKWSVKCFNEWLISLNRQCDEKCPEDLLQTQNPTDLNKRIARFIAEVRSSTGAKYTPRSIHQFLSGILRYMRSISDNPPNILDQKDTRLKLINNACEVIFWELQKEGVGTSVKHTPTITHDEELLLWDLHILNTDTPLGLQRAVFFYIGKLCCLRGGEEQHNLKISQFIRKDSDPPSYAYTEHGSKNHSGGLAQLNLENKEVLIYAVPENVPRCLVHLLDLYFSKLSPEAIELDHFYLRPKPRTPLQHDESWFDKAPVGKNKLSTFVKDMFLASLDGKANHSLGATGATCLFNAGVAEKNIQNTTGHRSVEALRKYENVSTEQSIETSRINESHSPVKSSSTSNDSNRWLPGFQGCSVGSLTININK